MFISLCSVNEFSLNFLKIYCLSISLHLSFTIFISLKLLSCCFLLWVMKSYLFPLSGLSDVMKWIYFPVAGVILIWYSMLTLFSSYVFLLAICLTLLFSYQNLKAAKCIGTYKCLYNKVEVHRCFKNGFLVWHSGTQHAITVTLPHSVRIK